MDIQNITEINEKTFWQLMDAARSQFGQDKRASTEWLKGQLLKLPSEQAFQFHAIMHSYLWAADKYGLWTAASILYEYSCSDDGFIDFRAWLIYQGKEVYLNALKDPDSLAEIENHGECEFEQLCYIGYEVYMEQTGRDAYRDDTLQVQEDKSAEISKDIQYSPFIEYPLELYNAEVILPKLCEKYLTQEMIAYPRSNSTWNTKNPKIRQLVDEGELIIEKMKKERLKTGIKSQKRGVEVR